MTPVTASLISLLSEAGLPQEKDPTNFYIWSGVAVAAIVLLIIAVAMIRKKYFPDEAQKDPVPAGFGISQLKELYDQGLLSDDEFNAAKAKIVTQSHAAFMKDKGKAKARDEAKAKDDAKRKSFPEEKA